MPVAYPPSMGQAEMPGSVMQGSPINSQTLSDVARPSHEDEDLEVVQGVKLLSQIVKELMQRVQSGPVEDVLVSILQKITSIQKKYDQSMAQVQGGSGQ